MTIRFPVVAELPELPELLSLGPSDTGRAYGAGIFAPRRCCVLYLILVLVFGTLIYIGWRAARSQATRPVTRVIGPDDDPDFLRRLGRN
jgi:hypothetical protein